MSRPSVAASSSADGDDDAPELPDYDVVQLGPLETSAVALGARGWLGPEGGLWPEGGVVVEVELGGARDERVHGEVVLEVLQLLDTEGEVVVLEDLVAHADDHRGAHVQ